MARRGVGTRAHVGTSFDSTRWLQLGIVRGGDRHVGGTGPSSGDVLVVPAPIRSFDAPSTRREARDAGTGPHLFP